MVWALDKTAIVLSFIIISRTIFVIIVYDELIFGIPGRLKQEKMKNDAKFEKQNGRKKLL